MNKTLFLLWAIYLGLLAVLFPHARWAWAQFEPEGDPWVASAAAFTFEAAVAAFTHKLSQRLTNTPAYKVGRVRWRRMKYQVGNIYFLALFAATAINSLANLAHAVEFGRDLAIFAAWGIPPKLYSLAFGAALPLISVLFAAVLSTANVSEQVTDDYVAIAKRTERKLKATELDLVASETLRTGAETALAESEHKRGMTETALLASEGKRATAESDRTASELLFADNAADRIRTARELWPTETNRTLAVIARTSDSYVSEVLRDGRAANGPGTNTAT